MSLVARAARYGVDGRALVDEVSLSVHRRKVHALLGPNGAGKSTLLRLLSGELRPESGEIALNGQALHQWTPQERARQRAVLPQMHRLTFGFTAAQIVALGRLPCPRRRADDEARIVAEALALAGVGHLRDRRYPTLSGGERARVQLARVLAQVWEPLEGPLQGQARYLLLDEPTASLDLAHQHDCLGAVRTLAARDLGVLVILHDPNLALRYADEVTLLREGRVLASGPPEAAITADSLERLYRVPVRMVTTEGARVVVVRDPVSAPARGSSGT